MKIEVFDKQREYFVNDDLSILNQLILLTQQYQRLNELMENKRAILQRRMMSSRRRRVQQHRHIKHLWQTLTRLALSGSAAAVTDAGTECSH